MCYENYGEWNKHISAFCNFMDVRDREYFPSPEILSLLLFNGLTRSLDCVDDQHY